MVLITRLMLQNFKKFLEWICASVPIVISLSGTMNPVRALFFFRVSGQGAVQTPSPAHHEYGARSRGASCDPNLHRLIIAPHDRCIDPVGTPVHSSWNPTPGSVRQALRGTVLFIQRTKFPAPHQLHSRALQVA